MKLNNEISSTEKLLDLIRSKNKIPEELPVEQISLPDQKKRHSPFKKSYLNKPVTVGVDIGKKNIKIVKIDNSSDSRLSGFDYRQVSLPPNMDRDSAEFSNYLGSELGRFCEDAGKVEIWSALPFDQVEIQNINVPKVAKKELENVIFWTAKKEMAFDDDFIFDYEVKGDVVDRGVPKTSVMAVAAPKPAVRKFKELFVAAGYPLTGLTLAPFTIQNILSTNWINPQNTVASIYMGWDFSRIDIFSKGSLVAVRSVKTGTNAMIDLLKEYIEKKIRPITIEQAEILLCSLSPDYKGARDDIGIDLSEAEIFEIIRPALSRIVTQLEMTFKNYSSNLDNEPVDKIFISSAMPYYQPINEYIGEQLGIDAEVLDPMPVEGPRLDSAPGMSVTERSQFALCLGLALSDSDRTPNLLFTYRQKKAKLISGRLNKGIIAACICIMLISLGYYSWQKYNIHQKQAEAGQLQKKLSAYGMELNEATLVQLLAHVKQQEAQVKEFLNRNRGTVALGEVSILTPPNIRLLNAKAYLVLTNEKDPKRSLKIDGIVLGNKDVLEAGLADYVTALKSSPVFSQAKIEKKGLEKYRSESVLHFNLDLTLS